MATRLCESVPMALGIDAKPAINPRGGGGDYNDMYSVVQTLGQLGL